MPPEIQEDKPVDLSWRPIAGFVVLILALFILTAVITTLVHRGFAGTGSSALFANGFIIYYFVKFGVEWLRNQEIK